MNQSVNPLHYLIIIVSAGLLFIPFLGSVNLFDWDEINFAESAREMLVSGDYASVQINFQPFWEKPPLFIWLQALSMKVFGINAFAARFPNAVFGIMTLCLIYQKGRTYFKGHIAHWWVLCYLGAFTPHLYFKTGLIDPVFNFFIFLGILQFYDALRKHSSAYNANRHFLMAGIFTGIAILCKGPVALLVSILVLFAMVFAKRMVWFFSFGNLLIYMFTCALVSSIWFLPETLKNGPYFIIEFIRYQAGLFSQNVAGHQQPFYYHTLVLLIGCFPVSIIALQCLFWVVLILFSIVKTKIVHYSSLCWLPLTFMGAYSIESINQGVFRFKWKPKLALVLIGFILATALTVFPLLMVFQPETVTGFIKDEFSRQNFMADAGWQVTDALPGILMFVLLVVFILRWKSQQTVTTFGILLFGNILVISLAAAMMTGRIEKHTQGTAIAFFASKSHEKCYIFHTGYKSYAPYFYANTRPLRYTDGLNLLNENFYRSAGKHNYLELSEQEKAELDDRQKNWLISGHVDRKVYFIAKTDDREGLDKAPQLRELWDRNGWVVYERK
jgi:4-amino-4-deoxy-L-arabinose transferase-like glycosyltransferase